MRRVGQRRPELAHAAVLAAESLTAGQGTSPVHQAAVQHFLWWYMPRRLEPEYWRETAEAAAELLDELGMGHLARVARSAETAVVLEAWTHGADAGARAFRTARAASGVEPPDTEVLAWGPVMGPQEAMALDAAERALGEAVRTRALVPGSPRWRLRAEDLTEEVLTRPLDLPPGQTLAGLVATERVTEWIDSSLHPSLAAWRAAAANQILTPPPVPAGAARSVAPVRWLLQLAAAPRGAELTQSDYLTPTSVAEATERFGWWEWDKPPRSESEVHQLSTVRAAAARLRLVRRRGRRLHVTLRGERLLADPGALWRAVALESEGGDDYGRMVTELVGLCLLRGRTLADALADEIAPVLVSQGWRSGGVLVDPADVHWAVAAPLRWWRIFGVLDEEDATWQRGTGRTLTPHTVALSPVGEAMVRTFLHARAAGPRRPFMG